MPDDVREGPSGRPASVALAGAAATITAPLLLLALLRVRPHLDVEWANHPVHFWLVLGAAAVAMALGRTVTAAARARHDARLLLVSLAFLSGAGFLGLHALATPGVLLGPNVGFGLATPVGLALGGVLVALSARDLGPRAARAIVARSHAAFAALVALLVLWAVVSLAGLPPLDGPVADGTLAGWQRALAVVGGLGYAVGAVGYLRLHARRGARLLLAVGLALALLAATMVVIAFAVRWHVSWWEWHVLMLAAFALIAAAAHEEWHEERFSALYLEETLAGSRDVSVLFADLQGFTAYADRTPPRQVHAMLNTYLGRVVPLLEDLGGEVHQLIGDAVMVVFNKRGDQPDHARLAAGAGLALQEAATEVAEVHPDWPRFRVGVNSGEVLAGVVGDRGHRKHDVIGDTVNLAARLEGLAPVGGVVIGAGTYAGLGKHAVVEPLPPLHIKGKAEPVTAYLLAALEP